MARDPPLLAFWREPVPGGDAAWRAAAWLLRALTWAFLASAAWATAYTGWMILQGMRGVPSGHAFAFAGIGVLGWISMAGLALALAWWATYAYGHWIRRRRTGYNHALWLAVFLLLMVAPSLEVTPFRNLAWHGWIILGLMLLQVLLALPLLVGCCLKRVRNEFALAGESAAGSSAT